MIRYFRLYLYFLRFSFSRAMEFRLDFFFRIVMDCMFYVVQLAFFFILYKHTRLLGGWNLDQIIIFTSAWLFLDAVNMTLFSNNMWLLPMLINKGDLDYYLVRPVSALFFVSFRDFAANSFVNLVIATGILAWSVTRYPQSLGAGRVLLFCVMLAIGSFLFYVIQMAFLIPTFWLHSSSGLWELRFQVEKYAERPDQIYSRWLRRILLSVVPLAFLISVPTHALFSGLDWKGVLHTAVVVAASLAFLIGFWRLGLRSYVSASS